MNDRNQLQEHLSPRASEMLTSLLDEMRDEILESALRRSNDEEISARDVIEAFNRRTGERPAYKYLIVTRQRRIQRLLGTYAATAAAVATATLIVSAEASVPPDWIGALGSTSLALVGASLALLATLMRRSARLSIRIQETERLEDGLGKFMDRWLRIESLLRLRVAEEYGNSVGDMPLGNVLEASLRSGFLDTDSYAGVRNLLGARNAAAHGKEMDPKTLSRAIRQANHLVALLESQIDSQPSRRAARPLSG